jgi:hypothetical protein
MRTIAGFLSCSLLLTACQKAETPASAPPQAVTDVKKLAEAAPAPVGNPLDPKVLLTDEKLGKYAVYQQTMLPVMGDVMAAAMNAGLKAGGDVKDFEKKLAADERLKRIEAVTKEALAKSGLTQSEATAIGQLVAGYLPNRSMGTDEDKKKARVEFEATNGKAAAEAMDKHEVELTRLMDETMSASMGAARK